MAKTLTLKNKIAGAQLYCVSLSGMREKDLLESVEMACRGGCDILQLREKECSNEALLALARKTQRICGRYGVVFIVNDRLDVALSSNADGVHLGQDDMTLAEAKAIVKNYSANPSSNPNFIVGCSTHSLSQALKAQSEGADYVGCGPIFSTPTKPGRPPVGLELILQYRENLKIPFVAIGGIDETNLEKVLNAGAKCVAVVRAAFATGNAESAVRSLKRIMTLRHQLPK